ncbi:MAG: peptidylprolyl isomerase [Desulfobacterales bacterium]|nr:peptidylprolyl isomerase [Desulfobacterales bacterium]
MKLDENADPKRVDERQQEADKIYKLAKEGKTFAELAKQYSEDSSREQGGSLGAFKKDAMVAPFADKAFAMKAGEISEPVRSEFGWHIIKVEKINEAQTTSLETASDNIRQKLVEEKARELALKKAEAIYDTLFDGEDLSKAAQVHALTMRSTDFFSAKGLKDKNLGNPQKFAEVSFALDKMAISEVLDLENGYYLLQVVDRQDAAAPALEAVKERVREDLAQKRRGERAKADAEEFNLQPMRTGFFKRGGAIPKIGYDPQISAAAFELKPEKALAEKVFEGREGWYLVQLKERKPPAAEDFAKEKETIVSRLTEQKKQSAFGQWLVDLKGRGKVEINTKLIQ